MQNDTSFVTRSEFFNLSARIEKNTQDLNNSLVQNQKYASQQERIIEILGEIKDSLKFYSNTFELRIKNLEEVEKERLTKIITVKKILYAQWVFISAFSLIHIKYWLSELFK